MSMAALIKIIIQIIFSFLVVQHPIRDLAQNYVPVNTVQLLSQDTTQQRALGILTSKCNVCHAKRNRRRVFTKENMNSWSEDIYQQVFIKKRMPKGKKIKLTSQDYQELLTWITATQNK